MYDYAAFMVALALRDTTPGVFHPDFVTLPARRPATARASSPELSLEGVM